MPAHADEELGQVDQVDQVGLQQGRDDGAVIGFRRVLGVQRVLQTHKTNHSRPQMAGKLGLRVQWRQYRRPSRSGMALRALAPQPAAEFGDSAAELVAT